MSIRVRFAPSPTGPLHIGSVRTALFNYLFAKKYKGKFILRIEDTDSYRFIQESQNYIQNVFKWCGISFDESPEKGGYFAPYIQSERQKIYQYHLDKLLKTNSVYFAFDTFNEIQKFKKKYESKKGKIFSYNYETRKKLRNSLTLSNKEVETLLNNNVPYVIRFKIPENKTVILHDIIRGKFSVETKNLDDKVLIKNDGTPTYHFANVVDDFTMEISHVIRGEEWLSSFPLHILLYQAFGYKIPIFAHLPLILKPIGHGNGKLSKRDAYQLKYPIYPLKWIDNYTKNVLISYKELGYFPEAFLNILALLGWTPPNKQEILSLSEMINQFELSKVHKNGAHFNIEKNQWINREYLLKKSDKELLNLYRNYLTSIKVAFSEKDLKIIQILKKHVYSINEIYRQGIFFYQKPVIINEKLYNKIWKKNTSKILKKLFDYISSEEWNDLNIENSIKNFSQQYSISFTEILPAIRLKLVGNLKGPKLSIIMEILGKKECLERIFLI